MAKLYLAHSLRKHADRSPALARLMVAIEGLIVAMILWFLGRLPADRASAAGRRLMMLIGPRIAKNTKVKRNLALAFPDLGRDEVEELARQVWGNIGAVVGEYPHLETICAREADQRMKLVVHDSVRALLQARKPVVFVSAHIANWEVAGAAGMLLGFPMLVVYAPLRNPRVDRMITKMRGALGTELVSRDQAMRPLMQHLKRGGCVGLLVDLRVDSGEPVPFFGKDMLTSVMPARLALKFACELVPARIERLKDAHFRMTFFEPVRPDDETADEDTRVLQMTRKVNALFESWIREHPDQWMCTKRRWSKRLIPDWLR